MRVVPTYVPVSWLGVVFRVAPTGTVNVEFPAVGVIVTLEPPLAVRILKSVTDTVVTPLLKFTTLLSTLTAIGYAAPRI